MFETDNARSYFKITLKIPTAFLEQSIPKKEFTTDESDSKPALSWHQVGTKLELSRHQVELLLKGCLEGKPLTDLMHIFDRQDRTKFKRKFINPMLDLNLLVMTIPHKPSSPSQEYLTTPEGKKLLQQIHDNEKV